jgi:membrane protein YqaA with SNARE-associated domain
MKEWYKRLHAWSLKWADTKWGVWALFICAFFDASILGLPTLMFFFALALLNIKKVFKYSVFGVLGTLAGAVAGYSIGHFAWLNPNGEFSGFAQFLIKNIPGFSEAGYINIQNLYAKYDFWILFVASTLPLPYKIFSISSGVFDINIVVFCIATLISQCLKYFVLALLTIKSGPEIKKLFQIKWKPFAILATTGIVITIILIISIGNR